MENPMIRPTHRVASVLLVLLLFFPAAWAGNTLTITGTVVKEVAPVADFRAVPRAGPVSLVVQFTDLSTNGPTSWAWDFQNDGTIESTLKDPSYTYTAAGTYTVSLTVQNSYGIDTEVKAAFISVTALTPTQQIIALRNYEANLDIPFWSKLMLTLPLNGALHALAMGNERAAIVAMDIFLRNVETLQKLRVLKKTETQYMVREARVIIDLIMG